METATPNGHKVVVNLTAGHEDADRVTVAFLIATDAITHQLARQLQLSCRDGFARLRFDA